VRRGLELRDLAAELRLPVASPLPRLVLGFRQAGRLMNAPSPTTPIGKRDRAILETPYGTGIRRAECAGLDVQDIDLREGTLLVRDGKGHKDRLVPLPERGAPALDSYLRNVRAELLSSPGEHALFRGAAARTSATSRRSPATAGSRPRRSTRAQHRGPGRGRETLPPA
jgi:integrase/recombinase XerD